MMEYALLLMLIAPPLALAVYRARRIEAGGFFDLGVVFAGIIFVYAWFPMIGLILAQNGYGGLQDQRVLDDIPTSEEIVIIGGHYLMFLVGFALMYGWRRSAVPPSVVPLKGNWPQVLATVLAAGLVLSVNFLGRRLLGIEGAESYIDSYTQFRQFPLVVQQIMSSLAQIEFSACLAVVVLMIAWKPRFHKYVAIAVFVSLLSAMFSGGSRTFGFLLAFAYLICFSIYVRRLKAIHLLFLAGLGLALFVFAGVFRADGGFDAFMTTLFQGGEFLSLFINSVDLLRHSADAAVVDLPWQLHWVDFLRLIPQQVLGFEKVDPAVWYVKTYYPVFYDAGGGLAFGAIAESVVGFGITEAFVKGALLGVAYAFVANRCISGRIAPLKVFIYVWFVVMSYQAVRDTTFSVFSRFVFQVLPVLIFVGISYRLMRLAPGKDHERSPMGLNGAP